MATSVWPASNQPWGPNCAGAGSASACPASYGRGLRCTLGRNYRARSAWVSGAGEPPGEGRSRVPSGARGCYSPREFGDSGGDRGNPIKGVRRAPQRRVRLGIVGCVCWAVTASCGGLGVAHPSLLSASARRDA
jgi:hypothetical protein